MLTDCINHALSQGIFSDSSTFANVTLVHKKDEATDKLQKVLKKSVMINLVNIWINTKTVYCAISGKLIAHNMLCSNYYKHGKKY